MLWALSDISRRMESCRGVLPMDELDEMVELVLERLVFDITWLASEELDNSFTCFAVNGTPLAAWTGLGELLSPRCEGFTSASTPMAYLLGIAKFELLSARAVAARVAVLSAPSKPEDNVAGILNVLGVSFARSGAAAARVSTRPRICSRGVR